VVTRAESRLTETLKKEREGGFPVGQNEGSLQQQGEGRRYSKGHRTLEKSSCKKLIRAEGPDREKRPRIVKANIPLHEEVTWSLTSQELTERDRERKERIKTGQLKCMRTSRQRGGQEKPEPDYNR